MKEGIGLLEIPCSTQIPSGGRDEERKSRSTHGEVESSQNEGRPVLNVP